MKYQLENGKGFLKNRLGNYRVDPPEKVWESISSRLGNRNRRLWIIIGLSAAATITLAVTLGINFFGPGSDDAKSISENRVVENGTTGQEGKLEEKLLQVMEDVEGGGEAEQKSVRMESDGDTEPNEQGTLNNIVKEPLAFQIEGEETLKQFPSENISGNKNMEEEAMEQVEVTKPEQNKYPVQDELSGKMPEAESGIGMEKVITDQMDTSAEPDLDQVDSQNTENVYDEAGERDKRWMLGASLSPLYSFRDAEAMALSGAAGYESGLLSYAGGIQVGYRAGKRLAIESGVFYAKMGISIEAPGIQLFEQSFDFAPLAEKANRSNVKAIANSVGNIVSNSGDIYVNNYKLNAASDENTLDYLSVSDLNADQGIRQHLNYLEVPLNLRYTVIDRSVELQLVGGMSTNFLVNNYVSAETSDGTEDIGYLTNIRNVNYSGNAGLGVVYHVMDHFSLMMEPRFRYFLNSVNDPSLPSTRPYAFGIYTGLNYIF